MLNFIRTLSISEGLAEIRIDFKKVLLYHRICTNFNKVKLVVFMSGYILHFTTKLGK